MESLNKKRTVYLSSQDELTFDQMKTFVKVAQAILWAWSEIEAHLHYISDPGQDRNRLISWSATFVSTCEFLRAPLKG